MNIFYLVSGDKPTPEEVLRAQEEAAQEAPLIVERIEELTEVMQMDSYGLEANPQDALLSLLKDVVEKFGTAAVCRESMEIILICEDGIYLCEKLARLGIRLRDGEEEENMMQDLANSIEELKG